MMMMMMEIHASVAPIFHWDSTYSISALCPASVAIISTSHTEQKRFEQLLIMTDNGSVCEISP